MKSKILGFLTGLAGMAPVRSNRGGRPLIYRVIGFGLAMASALGLAGAAAASPVTIDFSSIAAGTSVSTVPGGTVSLSGGPGGSGAPVVGYGFFDSVLSLNNSVNWGLDTSGYPTGSTITFSFASGVSGINFTFNNYGTGNGSFVAAFDGGGNLLESLLLDAASGFNPFSLASSGVRTLVFDNNSSGSYSYIFGIGQLGYTAVPEPGTLALLGLGLAGLGFARRRKAA